MQDHARERRQLEVPFFPVESLPLDLAEGPQGLLAPSELPLLPRAGAGTVVEVCLQLFEARAKHARQHGFGPVRRGHQDVHIFVGGSFVHLVLCLACACIDVGTPGRDLLCCVMPPVMLWFEQVVLICSQEEGLVPALEIL